MNRLHTLVQRGLEATAEYWPPIRRTYRWIHAVARILKNEPGHDATAVRRRLSALLGAMGRHRQKAGPLTQGVDHLIKVTASDWPGLFHGYDLPDLPRTNNALEQLFGSHRHHQRRATGHHAASPTLVARGQAQLLAATATRLAPPRPADLQPKCIHRWHRLREQLRQRTEKRTRRTRFRHAPEAYLSQPQHQLTQSTLPA
mgnify:CR=1 FL=1